MEEWNYKVYKTRLNCRDAKKSFPQKIWYQEFSSPNIELFYKSPKNCSATEIQIQVTKKSLIYLY